MALVFETRSAAVRAPVPARLLWLAARIDPDGAHRLASDPAIAATSDGRGIALRPGVAGGLDITISEARDVWRLQCGPLEDEVATFADALRVLLAALRGEARLVIEQTGAWPTRMVLELLAADGAWRAAVTSGYMGFPVGKARPLAVQHNPV